MCLTGGGEEGDGGVECYRDGEGAARVVGGVEVEFVVDGG